MQKISINRFKSQTNKRLNTFQNQKQTKDNIIDKQKIRFSQCIQYKKTELDMNVNQNIKKRTSKNLFSQFEQQKQNKSRFSRQSQFNLKDNILKNIIQSNQRKRFQILNNLIKQKRQLFKTTNKKNQHFKKLIKINTEVLEEKQNQQGLFNPRNKVLSQKHTKKNQKPILYPMSERKKPYPHSKVKLSARQSQILKNSFNQRIKQIKLRKYFQKDQLQINTINLFQAYGASIRGEKHAQNQDSVYFSQGIYVICDGHGSNGKQISNFIAETVHNSLSQCLQQNKIDQTIILQTYRKIQFELQNSNFQISFSGCTCVTILRYQNSIFCISLGDSRAILSKGYSISQISITHKPDRQKQKQRVQNYGGVIRQSQISKDKFHGPMRIWAPGKNSWGPGLALSRAFGDKASRKYGVISVPQVTKINLTSDEQFIVIGSDGLFDFFPDQQIGNFVKRLLKDEQIPKQQIPNELVQQARKKWRQDSDDISCIVIFI